MARPTAYRDEYARQAYHLALLGATDVDLAAAFDVDVSTVERWKNRHAAFRGALKKGKAQADANVAKSLYRRALGYSHKAVKIVADARTGAEHIVDYVERYPPDTVAAIFWLKNRRPDLWRDKQSHEITAPQGTGVLAVPVPIDAEAWADVARRQQAALTKPETGAPT